MSKSNRASPSITGGVSSFTGDTGTSIRQPLRARIRCTAFCVLSIPLAANSVAMAALSRPCSVHSWTSANSAGVHGVIAPRSSPPFYVADSAALDVQRPRTIVSTSLPSATVCVTRTE